MVVLRRGNCGASGADSSVGFPRGSSAVGCSAQDPLVSSSEEHDAGRSTVSYHGNPYTVIPLLVGLAVLASYSIHGRRIDKLLHPACASRIAPVAGIESGNLLKS
ncbi:MAG: hypothetical protein QW579_04640 [Desulfurococcaceae archaeon]